MVRYQVRVVGLCADAGEAGAGPGAGGGLSEAVERAAAGGGGAGGDDIAD